MNRQKITSAILLGAGFITFAHPTWADELADVKAALKQNLPNTQITSLEKTPIKGLYQMVTGKNLVYVDQTGRYSLIGTLYDMKIHADLTAKKLADLGHAPVDQKAVQVPSQSIPWDKLPHELAIVENKGAKYKLAIFADINCPYCRRMADIVKALPDVETHTFLISLWQRSFTPTKAILCATDKVAALHAAYKNQNPPTKVCESDALDRLNAFAAQHSISGTPFLIRSDGATSAGARSKEFLLDWLKEAAQ